MIEQLVEQIEARFGELERLLADPEVIADRERYAAFGREYADLESAAKLAREWRVARSDADGARELLEEGAGEEMRADLPDNAASPIYPNGTLLVIVNPKTEAKILVRVNNSGPYVKGRMLDVSRAAADQHEGAVDANSGGPERVESIEQTADHALECGTRELLAHRIGAQTCDDARRVGTIWRALAVEIRDERDAIGTG